MGNKSSGVFIPFNRKISKGSWGAMMAQEPGSGTGSAGVPWASLIDHEPRSARACEHTLDNREFVAARAGRSCQSCGKRMSAYNAGSLCYCCEDKVQAAYHAELDRKVEQVIAKRAADERRALEAAAAAEVFA